MVKVCLCPSFIKAFGDVIAAACPLPEKKKTTSSYVWVPSFPPSPHLRDVDGTPRCIRKVTNEDGLFGSDP